MPFMNRIYILAALVVLALIGGYWYTTYYKADTAGDAPMGTYAYICANGSQFSMEPSEDVSTVTLSAGSQGMFTGTATLHKMGDAAHFETTEGELIVFSGAGEEVQLTVGSETTICNPVPSTDSPPWNWGDAGEGGSVKPDTLLVVSESIQGKWQSVDDAKYVREFKAAGKVDDIYEGKVVSSGMWVAFVKGVDAPEVPYPLDDGVVYIQMTMTGTQADTLNFKLGKLTPEVLELVNLDRGGVLRFTSVQE